MSDVVLIFPRIWETRSGDDINLRPPLGILTLAGVLMENNISVRVIDQRVEPDWEGALKKEVKGDALCVGISSMSGDQIRFALKTSKSIREMCDLPIVWGGVHPSLEPESTIQHELVDIAVIGDGENSFLELVRCLKGSGNLENVRGIAFKRDGEIIFTPPAEKVDMDSIPFVPFHLVDLNRYRLRNPWFGFKGDNIIPLETSRGCSHRCNFCRESKRRFAWRAMSPERVIEHVSWVIDNYGINTLTFNDDNFFVDVKRAERIASLLAERGIDIEWYGMIRPDYVHRHGLPLLKKMEASGCKCLLLGGESGSNEVLKRMKKGTTIEKIFSANREMAKTKIQANYTSIVGLPYDTVDTVKETYEMGIRLLMQNKRAQLSIMKLIPTPATEILDECVKKGYKEPETLEGWADIFDTTLTKKAEWIDKDVDDWIQKHRYIFGITFIRDKFGFLGKAIFYLFAWIFLWRAKRNFYGLHFESKIMEFARRIRLLKRRLFSPRG